MIGFMAGERDAVVNMSVALMIFRWKRGGGRELMLVHRRAGDMFSLPAGRVGKEFVLDAGAREFSEETGQRSDFLDLDIDQRQRPRVVVVPRDDKLSVGIIYEGRWMGGRLVEETMEDKDIDGVGFYKPEAVANLWLKERIYKPELAGAGIVDWLVSLHNRSMVMGARSNLGELLGRMVDGTPNLRRDPLLADCFMYDWTKGQNLRSVDYHDVSMVKVREKRRRERIVRN